MIRVGSLVRYTGNDKRLWYGKMLSVHEVKGDKLVVWYSRSRYENRWCTITINTADVEEVC